MALPYDSEAKFQDYAHPEMIVSTDWVAAHLDDPGLVVAESDEDVLLYETGHVPGAVKLDWHTELNDPDTRDYVEGPAFARLMSDKGITRDTTLVLYGDKNNWWAAYALWVCSLFGHPDLRLMDGGRAKWIAEGRPVSTDKPKRPRTDYPVIERDDQQIRAFRDQVLDDLGQPLIDVRSPGEYSGELLHMPDYPQEGASVAATSPAPRASRGPGPPPRMPPFAAAPSSRRSTPARPGCNPRTTSSSTAASASDPATPGACCTICSVIPHVRNYDGSWTEWGNSAGSPLPAGTARDTRAR